jgi:hypothetical protein
MKEEFVTYETALALKELGFNEPCLVYWVFDGKEITFSTSHNKSGWSMIGYKNSQMNKKAGLCTAPLKQQAFRWFREKYKPEELNFYIHLLDTHTIPKEYLPCYTIRRGVNIIEIKTSDTYEEAESVCIDKLIEIIKNK